MTYSKKQQLARVKKPKPPSEYDIATERARCPEGYLRCERCGIAIRDGEDDRHHLLPRSRGGTSAADNLQILPHLCHMALTAGRPCPYR